MPVATIEASEVLGETARKQRTGRGVCVGRKFDSIEWRVIRITDEPIATIDDAEELAVGEIGELIVRGPQVSPQYVTGDAAAKSQCIRKDSRMANYGVGIAWATSVISMTQGRFWYCGRKYHRVETVHGTLYSECV